MPFSPITTPQSDQYLHRAMMAGASAQPLRLGESPEARKARKEKEKAQVEEADRLRMVMEGFGVDKGSAAQMSVGEMKGTLDVWAKRHALTLEGRQAEAAKAKADEQAGFQERELRVREANAATQAGQLGVEQEAAAQRALQAEQKAAEQRALQEREQRALQAGGAVGPDWMADRGPYGPGPLAPREPVSPGAAYLAAGGGDVRTAEGLEKVFAQPKGREPMVWPGPFGTQVVDLGNGQRQVVKPSEPAQEDVTFESYQDALAYMREQRIPEGDYAPQSTGKGKWIVGKKSKVLGWPGMEAAPAAAAPTPGPAVSPASFRF